MRDHRMLLWWLVRLCVIALIIFPFVTDGVKFVADGVDADQQWGAWQAARPIDFKVDLSTPGDYSGLLHQTCSIYHAQEVGLRIPSEFLEGVNISQLLFGLDARLRIIKPGNGRVVRNVNLTEKLSGPSNGGTIPLVLFNTIKEGTYEVTVDVAQGAPALSGIPQRLESHYLLYDNATRAFKGIGASIIFGCAIFVCIAILWLWRKCPKATL